MFGTILITAVTLMQVYVFWRIISIPLAARFMPKKAILGIGISLWTVFIAGRTIGNSGSGAFSVILELFGMNWMGTVLLLFVFIFSADVVTGFGLILPKLSQYLKIIALGAGSLLSIMAMVQGMRPPVIQDYEVYLPGLPAKMDGATLVAVSDMHLGSLLNKRWLESRVSQITELNPDIIVLLGDIYEGHGISQNEFIPALKNLSAPLGVWAILGNHERHRSSDAGVSLMEDARFNVLRDTWAEIRPGFVLAGIDDLTANHRMGQGKDSISKALTDKPKGATILLSHSPLRAEQASNAGVQLMLSGHTHAGQIWPFNYLVKTRYPMLEGRYEVNGMTVIVCRGTGTWGPRMRLWDPGEILRITLRSKKEIGKKSK
ncbi:MAG: metallophosphoesterase [Elusimicrobiota bacterium]